MSEEMQWQLREDERQEIEEGEEGVALLRQAFGLMNLLADAMTESNPAEYSVGEIVEFIKVNAAVAQADALQRIAAVLEGRPLHGDRDALARLVAAMENLVITIKMRDK